MFDLNSEKVDHRPKLFKILQPFILGGTAGCCATTCIQPIDMVKVQLQLAGESGGSKKPIAVARQIIEKEGFFALYKGLDAGIVRQLTYSTARLGLFRVFSDNMKGNSNDPLPLYKKALAAVSAGALASIVGNPADLSLIRLQADSTLPSDRRRNYKNFFDAFKRIVKEEGVLSLWRGCTPTVLRAMSLNLGMLASHDQAKEMLQPLFGAGWTTTLCSSLISGFFAVTFSIPFDFLKTRIQKMQPDPVTKLLPYKSVPDAFFKIAKKEGLSTFFSGYTTYYVRIAPHAMITLVSLEALQKIIHRIYFY